MSECVFVNRRPLGYSGRFLAQLCWLWKATHKLPLWPISRRELTPAR